MGWKAFKEHFKITHIVSIHDGVLRVGSAYIPDLVTISQETGKITVAEAFSSFLSQYYPKLQAADPNEILALLSAKDSFTVAIPVYCMKDGKLTEMFCEATGHPNVTHDGILMYEREFSTCKEQVIKWELHSAHKWVKYAKDVIAREEAQLARTKQEYANAQSRLAALEETYPDLAAQCSAEGGA